MKHGLNTDRRKFIHAFVLFGGLFFLCACVTEKTISAQLPADASFNADAGHGNLLIITVRLESGEALPFVVDTGTSGTLFDKSLESKLGKPVDAAMIQSWGKHEEKNVYVMPKLYLGKTQLTTGSNTLTFDLSQLSNRVGHPVMGILGLDVLKHYCIQLDFAADRMRFLDDNRADKKNWGKAFQMVALNSNDDRPSVAENLFGAIGPHSLIGSGYNADGWLMPKFYEQWTNQLIPPAKGETRSPDGIFGGEIYHQISLRVQDVESDGIGLNFLARHLVTLDFPKQTLYLRQTSYGR